MFPNSETPQLPPAPARRARVSAKVLVAAALVLATLTGSALGAAATAALLLPASASAAVISNTGTANLAPVGVSTASPARAAAANSPAQTVAGAVYQQVGPSIVEIVVTGGVTRQGLTPSGSGSGIIVDTAGHILTNDHVVSGAQSITVRFSTGEERPAQVVGTDRGNDLAVIQADLPAGVAPAVLGDSDQVQVGDVAIAIGSPFGLEGTVTQGIISAVHRDWQPDSGVLERDLIQTDAPINPGNSGGALLNAAGEVIGIPTAIESPVRGSVGVGFAVPINTAKKLLPQLATGAKLEPAWLGIRGQALTADLAQAQGLSVQAGILIAEVVTGSPADQAHLQAGDVLTAADGQALRTFSQLSGLIAAHKPGETLALTVQRAGQELNVTATLQARPADQ